MRTTIPSTIPTAGGLRTQRLVAMIAARQAKRRNAPQACGYHVHAARVANRLLVRGLLAGAL